MINCLHCGEEIFDLLRTKPPIHFSCLNPYINDLKARVDGLEETSKLYSELLYGVSNKYPDETRHETALRYIIERESKPSNAD